MTKIFKYPVSLGHNVVTCGEIVHFDEQFGQFFVWAASTRCRDQVVHLIMTGESFDNELLNRHIGTCISADDLYVVHAFTG